MPKFTLSLIAALLRLLLKSFEKVVALIITVLDLVDDGVANNSYTAPKWLETLRTILVMCKQIIERLNDISDEVSCDPMERSDVSSEGHA